MLLLLLWGDCVISPPLFPVICAAAATYQADWRALLRASGAFAIGFLAAIAAAVVVGLFHATDFRSDIVDRISAARMDYFIVASFGWPGHTHSSRPKFTKPLRALRFPSR